MNCEIFNQRLDAYLDGDLSPVDARRLEAHSTECAECGRVLAAAQDLQRRAFALPSAREPSRDLWPGIVTRLEPRHEMHRQRNATWLRAVAATVAVVAVFAGGMLADRVLQESVPTEGRMQAAADMEADRGLPSVAEARRILPASHVELIEGSGGGLQQAAEQDLLRNLLVVNLAIRRVESAVEQEPTNANLREFLADLYAKENRILVEAERLRVEQQSPTRTGI